MAKGGISMSEGTQQRRMTKRITKGTNSHKLDQVSRARKSGIINLLTERQARPSD